jgi:hypothetical protein
VGRSKNPFEIAAVLLSVCALALTGCYIQRGTEQRQSIKDFDDANLIVP